MASFSLQATLAQPSSSLRQQAPGGSRHFPCQTSAVSRPGHVGPAQRSLAVPSPQPLKPSVSANSVTQPGPLTDELTSSSSDLASLSELVKGGYASADEINELKKAFGELTEDLKKQIENVNLTTAKPGRGSAAAANVPSRRRLTPSTGSEEFKASSVGLRDLEGLIVQPQTQPKLEGEEGEEPQEPGVPRSQVIAMRSRLNKKLSESNTYNRFLMREIQYREEAIRETKHVLVALLSEMKEVASTVDELASVESFLPSGMVNSNCMPSVLKLKFQGLVADLEKQLQGVEAMKLREVPLVWIGMAEDVKVMGSFDGWTYGEQMSPEFIGTATQFSTVLKLRPGRYEIKFVVDGEWRVAPQWPTVGHGMTENNILVVD